MRKEPRLRPRTRLEPTSRRPKSRRGLTTVVVCRKSHSCWTSGVQFVRFGARTLALAPDFGGLFDTIGTLGGTYHGPLRSSAVRRKNYLLARLDIARMRGVGTTSRWNGAIRCHQPDQAKPVRSQRGAFHNLRGL